MEPKSKRVRDAKIARDFMGASVEIRGQGIEEWGGCGIAWGLYFFGDGGVGGLGGAGFVDEVAEVAFGVAAVGVAAFFVFSGDFVHSFVDGAAFRGLVVEFELRTQEGPG